MIYLLILVVVTVGGPVRARAEKFEWQRFEVAGRPAFMVLPAAQQRRSPMPWVMYAPTFDKQLPNESHEGWMIERFLDAGIAIAGVDVGESYGSPAGRATYNSLYEHLTASQHDFSRRACLLARSRGGLMLYNWASENPDKVACIAGIYPVCNLESYPGIARAAGAYDLTAAELTDLIKKHNPIERLAPLAKAKIPIFHIHGNVDTVVPLEANSGRVAKIYATLGGQMELQVAKDQGHNMWPGFFQCERLVEFVIQNATAKPNFVPPPIARWSLDEQEGELASDSIAGRNGQVIGAQPVLGKQGGARLFDRSNGDHIAIDYAAEFAISTFTVSAWVKLTRPPTFSGILGTRFGSECTFDMKVNDAKVHGDIGDGAKWLETKVNFYADDKGSNEQGGDLALERWYHIVYVIDSPNQECRLYLDADLKKTVPFEGKPLLMQKGQQMRIGNSSADEFMDGVIDEVTIWNSALSTKQVRAVYAPAADQ
jgi:pimeloyl-ACP methyl ester carboxylesterase